DGVVQLTGGTNVVTGAMIVGDCGGNGSGIVSVVNGSLLVTNAAHTAVLDLRTAGFSIFTGTLVVDHLVMTNACGHFSKFGSSVTIGTLTLDPALDADGDGLPNGWEQQYGLDPLVDTGSNG